MCFRHGCFQLLKPHFSHYEPCSPPLHSWLYLHNILRICRAPLPALPNGSVLEAKHSSWSVWRNILFECFACKRLPYGNAYKEQKISISLHTTVQTLRHFLQALLNTGTVIAAHAKQNACLFWTSVSTQSLQSILGSKLNLNFRQNFQIGFLSWIDLHMVIFTVNK